MEGKVMARQLIVPPSPLWEVSAGAEGPIFAEVGLLDMAHRVYELRDGPRYMWQVEGYVTKDRAFWCLNTGSFPLLDVQKHGLTWRDVLGFSDLVDPEAWREAWERCESARAKAEAKKQKAREARQAKRAREG